MTFANQKLGLQARLSQAFAGTGITVSHVGVKRGDAGRAAASVANAAFAAPELAATPEPDVRERFLADVREASRLAKHQPTPFTSLEALQAFLLGLHAAKIGRPLTQVDMDLVYPVAVCAWRDLQAVAQ